MSKEYATPKEYALPPKVVARYLRKHVKTIRKHCIQGILPAEKEGRDWIISVTGLKERFPRLGANFWYEVALDYYHSQSAALEAKAEAVRVAMDKEEDVHKSPSTQRKRTG